ncbi:hypothetical protein [Paenibacillus wenxiniae]|uniref:DUF4367 domain-containing protein n=1 Tax=Paenibacillus wenxiniae TaxID=1636843 RepID=A0ABW4RN04_9BACL
MKKIVLTCTAIATIALCAACSNTANVDESNTSASSAQSVTTESTNTENESAAIGKEPTSDLSEEGSDRLETSTSEEATSTPTSTAKSTHSTPSDAKASPATDDQKTALYHYVNSRYGYSIAYPATWTAGEESDNGDGKMLYVGNPDIDIRVYAANDMEDVSDPYHHDDQSVQRQRVALDSGKEGTLVIGKEDDQILYDMVYVSTNDVEYHFYAKVPQPFFDQNEKLLLKVAKSLDFPDE